ncbi:Dimethylglycine oxidase [Baekduia alba]|nr:Dimethylglycine oxidase [Baekduia alba]
MSRRVVIVGGGIVGAALAAELSVHDRLDVVVVERGPASRLLGSTGHAPGFVGLLGDTQAMTELARSSAEIYAGLEYSGQRAFERVGGLEVASSAPAMAEIERRAAMAADLGMQARRLDPEQAAACAPDLVDPASCVGAVHYPQDGTARAGIITAALKQKAVIAGVRFVCDAPVTAMDVRARRVRAVHTPEETFVADDVVLACGVWGPPVAALAGQSLHLVPVGHPYVYGPGLGVTSSSSPFVRWPEHHVYARRHDDRLGMGTYDHVPLPIDVEQLGDQAEQPWHAGLFDPAVERAMDLLPAGQRFDPEERLNGVFAMTADNQPLLGPADDVEGLWVAEALWVTHAAGAARALVKTMLDMPPTIGGLDALRPGRFGGRRHDELTASALRLYRDIYATT